MLNYNLLCKNGNYRPPCIYSKSRDTAHPYGVICVNIIKVSIILFKLYI